MASTSALAGTVVLVTRPAHQADELCRLIEDLGGTALRMPALEICAAADPARVAALARRLDEFDMALFTSANAVRFGIDEIRRHRHWPARLPIGAVGQGTMRALAERGLPATLRPDQDFSSAGLLELPALQQVRNRKIVIFRGEGGRELLADTLRSRGAQVEYAEVYRRCRPKESVDNALTEAQRRSIDVVVVTSNESLHNLYAMAGESRREWLRNLPLVVVSARARQLAVELGFRRPARVTAQASDESIVASLCAWKQQNKDRAMSEKPAKATDDPGSEQREAAPVTLLLSAEREPKRAASAESATTAAPTANQPPPPSKNTMASTLSVSAALLALVAAGGGYYLWQELTRVQERTGGVSQAQLDTASQALNAEIGKSAAELRNADAEVRSALERQLADASAKAEQSVGALRAETQQSLGEIKDSVSGLANTVNQNRADSESALGEAKAALESAFQQAIGDSRLEIANVNGAVSELRGSFGELRQELGERLVNAEQAQSQLRDAVAQSQLELSQAVARNRLDWAVAEVEHMLRLANEQAQIEQSPSKALATLRLADQRLQALDDPKLLPVRTALGGEIAALEQVPAVDVEGLALTLVRLAESSTALPFRSDRVTVVVTAPTTEQTPAETAWDAIRGFALAAWDGLRGLITVRESGEVSPPLLAPEQSYFLQQNLRLQLESARLSLLRRDDANLHASLAMVTAWLERYYDIQATATQSFLADLNKINETKIGAALPDISTSLRTLREIQPTLKAAG